MLFDFQTFHSASSTLIVNNVSKGFVTSTLFPFDGTRRPCFNPQAWGYSSDIHENKKPIPNKQKEKGEETFLAFSAAEMEKFMESFSLFLYFRML